MFSKFATTSFLFSNSYFLSKSFKTPQAQCENKTTAAAEKGAQDLDAIFASTEGGIPPDPEEIQEMILKA